MDFTHLDVSVANMDRLKKELNTLESEEARLSNELSQVKVKKQAILDQLKNFNDDRYEESMLQMVYEQRRGKR